MTNTIDNIMIQKLLAFEQVNISKTPICQWLGGKDINVGPTVIARVIYIGSDNVTTWGPSRTSIIQPPTSFQADEVRLEYYLRWIREDMEVGPEYPLLVVDDRGARTLLSLHMLN